MPFNSGILFSYKNLNFFNLVALNLKLVPLQTWNEAFFVLLTFYFFSCLSAKRSKKINKRNPCS